MTSPEIIASEYKYHKALMIILGMGVALVLVIVIAFFWIRHERMAAFSSAFRADSAQAAADTSRRLLLAKGDSMKLLGDSLGAVERRIVQVEVLNRDALDKATASISALRSSFEIQIRALSAKVASTAPVTADSLGVRAASFRVDSVPYHVDAAVKLPPPPASGTIALGVHLDPATLSPRVSCGAAVAGIRPTSVVVVAPQWLTVQLGATESTRDVCNADAARAAEGVRVPGWLALTGGVLAFLGGVWVAR